MAQLGYATPGIGASVFSQSNQFMWGGTRAEVIEMEYQIDSSARDAGSNNTAVLRPGLAMGKITATGLLKELDVAASDGSQNFVGFLKEETPLINTFGQAQTAFAPVVVKAPVKAKNILYKGVTIVGHASESTIRAKIRPRFLLDDEEASQAYAALNVFTQRTRVTAAQVNAGFTLLPAVAGLKYRLNDVSLVAIGGNASGATTVDILGTQSTSSVKLLAGAVAGLTQSSVLRAGAANGAVLADGASFVPNDVNTAITIGKTGSNLATSTHVDVLLTYELLP